jgi:hypothetical protein
LYRYNAAYQIKMDDSPEEDPVLYTGDDNDDEIRAAAPASPRRLVRRLRSPADSGEDLVVGHLQVRRVVTEGKVLVGISCNDEPAEAEETRCANCGKRSANNRACRGCLVAHFCNSECQREGWGDHKAGLYKLKSVDPYG